MTSTEEHILQLLNGATSQQPMALNEVVLKSGLVEVTVKGILQNMYHSLPSIVNRAEITRAGIKDFYYWPTGIVAKAVRQGIVINPEKRQNFDSASIGRTTASNVRRSETNQQSANERSQITTENDMGLHGKNKDQGFKKVSGKTICQYVYENPGTHFDKLYTTLADREGGNPENVRDMVYYLLRLKALEKSSGKFITLGTNDEWLTINQIGLQGAETKAAVSTAPALVPTEIGFDKALVGSDMTFETQVVDGEIKFQPLPEATSEAAITEPAAEVGVESLADVEFSELSEPVPVAAESKIKFALTEDNKLLIFGLFQEQMVEFTPEETERLVEFVYKLELFFPGLPPTFNFSIESGLTH
ncbi:MAG TPA: hypothetical protein VK974_00815 [Methylophilaceae bacterium]|nr:hypothetical protein [Methylophilaceae bacterium]